MRGSIEWERSVEVENDERSLPIRYDFSNVLRCHPHNLYLITVIRQDNTACCSDSSITRDAHKVRRPARTASTTYRPILLRLLFSHLQSSPPVQYPHPLLPTTSAQW